MGRGASEQAPDLAKFQQNAESRKPVKLKIKRKFPATFFRRSLLNKLILKGHSLDKIKKTAWVSIATLNTLYEDRSNQEYELKENPLLAVDYHKTKERMTGRHRELAFTSWKRVWEILDLMRVPAKKIVSAKIFSKDQDGLQQDWQGSFVWVNPPYSEKNAFIEKAHEEARKGAKIIMLMPAFGAGLIRELKTKSGSFILEWSSGSTTTNKKETAKFSSVIAFFNIEKRELVDLGWSVWLFFGENLEFFPLARLSSFFNPTVIIYPLTKLWDNERTNASKGSIIVFSLNSVSISILISSFSVKWTQTACSVWSLLSLNWLYIHW